MAGWLGRHSLGTLELARASTVVPKEITSPFMQEFACLLVGGMWMGGPRSA